MSTDTELEMTRKRRRFAVEFKKHIVAEIESGQLSLTGAARKYSISPTAITRWREKGRHGELVDKASARETALEKEVRQLREKVGELTMQNDLLKKFDDYLRRLKSADSLTITGLNWDRIRKHAP